ncbi:MAG: TPM domain-containing protein [Chloroflexota bacterium]
MTARRRALTAMAALGWLLTLATGGVAAAESTTPPAGPPFPEPIDGQAVYDFAGIFTSTTIQRAEQIVDAIEAQTRAEVVVYTQALGRDDITAEETERHATALMDEWGVGRAGIDDGLVILFNLNSRLEPGQVQLVAGEGFRASYLSQDDLAAIHDEQMLPLLGAGDPDTAVLGALARIITATFDPSPPSGSGGVPARTGPPPGPPFPDPEIDRAVYDYAGILSDDTIVAAEAVIDTIEERTGAEIVVYTQDTGEYGISTEETEVRARALIDQWGIGRAGFDDGLVIFIDLEPNLLHGQVQLYAAPGFEAAYLSNSERQSIFDNDMLPLLREADFDGAIAIALERIDAAATAEHATQLQQARQVNAVLGLVGAPVLFMGLAGWAFVNWRRYGKDPVYLDDPSILMPAPPPDLTAASGAMVMDGGTSRRALTTAMLDLASRGLISFREDGGILGFGKKVGVDVAPPRGDEMLEAQRARNGRRPTGPAEGVALQHLRSIGGRADGDYITPEELPKFGQHVSAFDAALEKHVVGRGWFKEPPSKVMGRWIGKGFLVVFAGIAAVIAGFNLPISGLVLVGAGTIAGGIVIVVFAKGMPAVTMPGAMIRAMLAAYRRTLQKTMAQARSMQQVVDEAGLDWLDTPDQAVVWGTALGLQDEIEEVLSRSLEDVRRGTSSGYVPYFPAWYQGSSGTPLTAATATGSGGGLFANSGVPDLGGMMSALGTIGNSPSSSGGGGGFSGGSSGGGGGGSGGRF